MLERVPLVEKSLTDFAEVVGDDQIDRIRELAAPLQGARILHVNATAYGGGVAELLATHIPLLRNVGINAEWQVIHGSDEFFGVTKTVHNALQGAEVEWTSAMEKIYLDKVKENAALVEGEWDYVVIHDPQPAAMLSYLQDSPVNRPDTKWIWRCHIDLTNVNEQVWGFFRPFVEMHDASVWTMQQFVPDAFTMDKVVIAPPCIDPLSVKNMELPELVSREICKKYGIDVNRPLMTQVSRFDPWKDPLGVLEAYRMVRDQVPGLQLLLAGSMATDDPEGFQIWQDIEKAKVDDPDVHLLSNLQQVGNVEINAFYAESDVVLQKSLREGFGLTVSEALWKGRPVIGGDVGGITMQIQDGKTGFLVNSIQEAADRSLELLADPKKADAMGAAGKEWVRENFLSTRELRDWLGLFGELA